MTKKEILRYNKRCAKFLGWQRSEKHNYAFIIPKSFNIGNMSVDYYLPEYLEFHSDWNWIMKVVERIKFIEDNQGIFFGEEYYRINFEIDLLNGVDFRIDEDRIFMQTSFGKEELKEAVVKGISAFLKWYKKHKI